MRWSCCIGAMLATAGCTPVASGLGTEGESTESLGESDPSGSVGDSQSTTGSVLTTEGNTDPGLPTTPMIEVSDEPVFDFGDTALASLARHNLVVTNRGVDDVQSIGVTGFLGDFGGGTNGCEGPLGSEQSCSIEIMFNPSRFGDQQSELQISAERGGATEIVNRSIRGRGVGRTENLLINGDAEAPVDANGEIPGWTARNGHRWSVVDRVFGVSARQGQQLFYPGRVDEDSNGPDDDFFELSQTFPLVDLTTWGTTDGLRLHYRLYRCALEFDNDRTKGILNFLDPEGQNLESVMSEIYSDTQWLETQGETLVPAQTESGEFVLRCGVNTEIGPICNGYFDSIEVWAEWNG